MISLIPLFFSLLFFISCASHAPKVVEYRIDMDKGKISWEKAISELEERCLNSVGVKVNQKNAPAGKLYKYSCEIRKYPEVPKRDFPNASDRLLMRSNHFIGYKTYTSGGSVGSQFIFPFVEKYYFKRNEIKQIWKGKLAYVSFINSYILSNGYTFLTIGKRDPWAINKYKGVPYYIMRIEGFSQKVNPSLDEIHGRVKDIPIENLDSVVSSFKKYVNDNHRREKNIQENHNTKVYAIRAKQKRARMRSNRSQSSGWGEAFGRFAQQMNGGGSDQQFWSKIKQTEARTLQNIRSAQTNRKKKNYRPRKTQYRSNTTSQRTSNSKNIVSSTRQKRSFSPSYNKKNIAKKFPGRTYSNSSGRKTFQSKKLNKPKTSDVSKIACVTPYAFQVKGVHGFNILEGGSVAAGGPYCEHFRPDKGKRDCSGHKRRHAGDFILRGKKHCEKLRNGMTYVSTSFTECNCGVNDANNPQCRIAYKHLCR